MHQATSTSQISAPTNQPVADQSRSQGSKSTRKATTMNTTSQTPLANTTEIAELKNGLHKVFRQCSKSRMKIATRAFKNTEPISDYEKKEFIQKFEKNSKIGKLKYSGEVKELSQESDMAFDEWFVQVTRAVFYNQCYGLFIGPKEDEYETQFSRLYRDYRTAMTFVTEYDDLDTLIDLVDTNIEEE